MSEKLVAGQDILGIIDDIVNIPDSFFKASTGNTMVQNMLDQINLDDLVKEQTKDFLERGIGYDQAVMLCAEMKNEISALVDSFEGYSTSSEKKVFLKKLFGIFNPLPEMILKDYPRYDANIPVELCHPNAKLPAYAHDGDAGADVFAVEDTDIEPDQTIILHTGLKTAIPKGWMLSVRPRSGMSLKTGLRVANAPGTIDYGYLAEIGIIVNNIGKEVVSIHTGDKIAQLVLEKVYKAEYTVIDDITTHATENRANSKGEQGFGSTDSK